MKAITLRNIPADTALEVERKSREWNLSLNKTVLRLLEAALGLPGRSPGDEPTRHYDLDELAGVWGEEEAKDFDRRLAAQRPIDPELWE